MLAFARKHVPVLVGALLVAPAFACAALININTADTDQLDALPGIGPSKAAAIVEYRTEHGPFTRIEDLQNVSGIGAVTFEHIKAFITVDDSASSAPADTSASSTQAAASAPASGGSGVYTPAPAELSVNAGSDRSAFLDVPLSLAAKVKTKSGAADSSAAVTWSFGDGSQASGPSVEKTYRFPGTYLVVVTAADGAARAQSELTVTASTAQVRITDESGSGILVANDAAERLDLSRWQLSAGGGVFRLPPGTILLPYASVLFPYEITDLPVAFDAVLAYPDGAIAARYTPSPAASSTPTSAPQLSGPLAGSQSQQPVDPAPVTSTTGASEKKQHETATVSAPAAATNVAAAGAAFAASSSTSAGAAPAEARARQGLLSSPWTFGFLGLVTLVGGALMIL